MRRFVRHAFTLCGTMAAWAAFDVAAFAQSMPAGQEKPEGSYVVPYMIVLLGVGLGMAVLCRSSSRRERATPEQYEEGKFSGKE